MADKKISQLTAATLPFAGTEVLPIVQSNTTLKVSVNDLAAGNLKSQTTTGVLQVSGPAAGTTRVMTTPNANFTAARTDAAQTFTGTQTFSGSYANFVADVTKSSLRIGSDGANDIYLSGTIALGISGLAGINLNAGTGLPRAVGIGSTGNVTIDTGNLIQGTAAKGVNFTANTPAAGMTSQLLNWYEEGTWTPVVTSGTGTITSYNASGYYTRVGRLVTLHLQIGITNNGTGASYIHVTGAPFSSGLGNTAAYGFNQSSGAAVTGAINGTAIDLYKYDATYPVATGQTINITVTYFV